MADTTEALLRESARTGGNSTEAPEGAVVVNQPGEPVESSPANAIASGANAEIDCDECLSCQ